MKCRKQEAPQTSLPHTLRHELACGRHRLALSSRTHVMGILNITPDSFSDAGEYFNKKGAALKKIEDMVRDGADIIDIGGESTRPGADSVSEEAELDRVIPIIKEASRNIDVPISIDTAKAEVAEAAIASGASIVNDTTGLRGDDRMASVVAKSGAGLIVMHMRGAPRTMQDRPMYENLIGEIISSLRESIETALENGVRDDMIIVDPGIGFGKTVGHNLEILRRLAEFKALGMPVMVGVSRKSFLGKILNADVKKRLMGTAAACAIAIMNGASIIRVHDTKEMVEVGGVVASGCGGGGGGDAGGGNPPPPAGLVMPDFHLPDANTASTARSSRCAACASAAMPLDSASQSSIIAADRLVAAGFALPCPAMSGADP